VNIRRRTIVVALVLAVAFVTAGLVVLMHSRQRIGITDDFKDVKLEQVIAFAERANSAYHEDKDFRHEYGPRIVHDEDPIPMLPPVSVEEKSLALYHHCGPEVIVRASGYFLFLPEHSATRMNITQYWADIKNFRPMSHDMVKGYLPALKSALANSPPRASPPKRG
jgi:hypothetical protein